MTSSIPGRPEGHAPWARKARVAIIPGAKQTFNPGGLDIGAVSPIPPLAVHRFKHIISAVPSPGSPHSLLRESDQDKIASLCKT
jgi:hypothetical protein